MFNFYTNVLRWGGDEFWKEKTTLYLSFISEAENTSPKPFLLGSPEIWVQVKKLMVTNQPKGNTRPMWQIQAKGMMFPENIMMAVIKVIKILLKGETENKFPG